MASIAEFLVEKHRITADQLAAYLQALASVPEGDLFVSEFSLSISGKLRAISSNLEKLRTGDRLILVSNLVFSESDTASDQTLRVDISAEVFAMRKPN